MAAFPSITQPSTFSEKIVKKAQRVPFEDGPGAIRPLWSSAKRQFKLGWPKLPDSEKDTLFQFIEDNTGITFEYTHPKTSVVYDMAFTDDEHEGDLVQRYVQDGEVVWAINMTIETL